MPKPKTETEVVAEPKLDRRQRRNFATEYKERFLHEVDACAEPSVQFFAVRACTVHSSAIGARGWRARYG